MGLAEYESLKSNLIAAMKIETEKIPELERKISALKSQESESKAKLKSAEEEISRIEIELTQAWNETRLISEKQGLRDLENRLTRSRKLLNPHFNPRHFFIFSILALLLTGCAMVAIFVMAPDTGYFNWEMFFVMTGIFCFLPLLLIAAFLSWAHPESWQHKAMEKEVSKLEQLQKQKEKEITKFDGSRIQRDLRLYSKPKFAKHKKSLDEQEKEISKLEYAITKSKKEHEELLRSIAHLIPFSSELPALAL